MCRRVVTEGERTSSVLLPEGMLGPRLKVLG